MVGCWWYRWVSYEQARPALACSQYLCLSDLPTQNGLATESSTEERQEAENMEESSEIENDNEEMSIDTLIVDAEYLPSNGEGSSNGEQPSDTGNDPPSPLSTETDVTMEKDKDHSESLGQIILLLNNKCLTFKVLLHRIVAIAVVLPLSILLSLNICSSIFSS